MAHAAPDETTYTIQMLTLGMWQANCYIVGNNETNSAFIIDPGQGGTDAVEEVLSDHDWTPTAILLTHGHIDHLWSAPELARRHDIGVRLHSQDEWLWNSPAAGTGMAPEMLKSRFNLEWDPPSDRLEMFNTDHSMSLLGIDVLTHHTPGHTPGSTVFSTAGLGSDPIMFSGDLIFQGSVGRTDFPRGSYDTQVDSLRRVVLPAADTTVILSGHGPATTVGREKLTNPFLKEAM